MTAPLRRARRFLCNNPFRLLARYAPFGLRRRYPLYHRLYKGSLRQWLLHHQAEIVYDRCTWMGVKALKNPLDAWIYQEILHEVRPDVVVELGSAAGGGTLYLAHLLEIIGNGVVVSVDIDRSDFQAQHSRIITITGHSTAPETLAEVRRLCEGKRVLVIHDADHHMDQVVKDMRAYAPLVSVGSYFIVEDGLVDLFRPHEALGVPYDGPLAATEAFLSHTPDFEVDAERERYLLTYNPRGFLRRVRCTPS
ncbi:MAG TPA: CmcI family methyltransferase [Acidimicrobiales bacterium]|nr:CmcI family methyltransferase [Acidimicrobiales bacterium]